MGAHKLIIGRFLLLLYNDGGRREKYETLLGKSSGAK